MRTPGKRASGSILKVSLVIVLPLGVALWAAWGYVSQALSPQVSQTEAQVVCAVSLLLWVVCMVVAEKRTQARLDHQRTGAPSAGFVSALTGSMHVGSMTSWSVVTIWRVVAAILSLLAVALAAGLVVILAGYAPVALDQPWPWAVIPAGLLTAYAIARKAASFMDVSLSPRMLTRQVAGWPLGAAGAAVAFFTTGMPASTSAAIGTTAGLAVTSTATGLVASRQERRKQDVVGNVAAALGVAQDTFEKPHKARWRVNRDGSIQVFAPLPADVIKSMDGLEAGLATRLATHEVVRADPKAGIHLGLVSPDTAARRQLLAETEGLLEALEDVDQPDPPDVQITTEDLEEAHHD